MGEKGAKLTQQSSEACERVVEALSSLGDISSKKMFGGYGIFENSAMFALVDSQGEVYFKADDTNISRFQDIDAKKHGRMPYYQIPDEILDAQPALLDWARSSIAVAHSKSKK